MSDNDSEQTPDLSIAFHAGSLNALLVENLSRHFHYGGSKSQCGRLFASYNHYWCICVSSY